MDGGAGSEYGEMQTRCVRWARSSVSDPRPWKDEGRGRYDFPRILRPGRGPRTEGRTPNPVPGTWYLAPVPHSHLSNLNAVLLLC
jgi:hypothetical protein